MQHRSRAELDAALDSIRRSPSDVGRVEHLVRRPAEGAREVVFEARLDEREGLVGDGWLERGCSTTADGSANPDAQVTIVNARAIDAIAGERDRWSLAGDQLYVDLDLSGANLPAGTRLELGSALLEVTAEPHTGCGKFLARYGVDASKFVNSPAGRELNLRGINTRVLRAGTVRVGDVIRKHAVQD